ncbi:MAG TPA: endonuclease III [Candidatus Thermoplasmatota archaeon]|nr:endonuclease III [Candidatus Thermoplasmatota archaeon]
MPTRTRSGAAKRTAARRPAASAPPVRRPRESDAEKRTRATLILERLRSEHGSAHAFLHADDPLQTLVATMLSAQCTDAMVNRVTPALFARCARVEDYATIPRAELERLVHRTGFYRAKARNVQLMARALLERHGGEVPRTMEELHALPGVGRKTANVVLGNAYGLVEGVCVDTHVGRLARRMDLTRWADPVKVERDLMTRLPRAWWWEATYLLISHGRAVCAARRPACATCPVRDLCPRKGVLHPR